MRKFKSTIRSRRLKHIIARGKNRNQYKDGKKHGYWEEPQGESGCIAKGEYDKGQVIGKLDFHHIGGITYSILYRSHPIGGSQIKNYRSIYIEDRHMYKEVYDMDGNITYVSTYHKNGKAIGEIVDMMTYEIVKFGTECYVHPSTKSKAFPEFDDRGRIIQLKDLKRDKIIGKTTYNELDEIIEYSDILGNYYNKESMPHIPCFFKLEDVFTMEIISFDIKDEVLRHLFSPLEYK